MWRPDPKTCLPTIAAQVSGAIIGGMSAAAAGGDVGQGMLFGVIAGTFTGPSMGAMSDLGYGKFTLGKMAMAAPGGAAAGASRGYAGGKGSLQDIVKQGAMGAGVAAIIAGAAGVLQGKPLLPSSASTGSSSIVLYIFSSCANTGIALTISKSAINIPINFLILDSLHANCFYQFLF